MRLRKWIGAVMVLALLFSVLPGSAVAVGPTPAAGRHIRWIDRIAYLPDYASEFYRWLETNSNADGALVDPTRGSHYGSAYAYPIKTLKGSLAAGANLSAQQLQVLINDHVNDEVQTVMDYAFAVYGAFDRDHPEVFWLTADSMCAMSLQYTHNKYNSTVSYEITVLFYLCSEDFDIRLSAYRDPNAIRNDIARREADIQRILANCPSDGDVAQKVRYLNRELVRSNSYNSCVAAGDHASADPLAWKCVSALSGCQGVKGPVCEGYARAFKVLCDRVDIPCVLNEGIARYGADTSQQAHMWNYVFVENNWYAVDVTWNDPLSCEGVSNAQEEKFLLIGGDTLIAPGLSFSSSHSLRNAIHEHGPHYNNGPVLSASAYSVEEQNEPTSSVEPPHTEPTTPQHTLPSEPTIPVLEGYMEISPYRGEDGYTAPQKDGCVFAGWFADEGRTHPLSKDVTSGMAYAAFVDESVLTAKYQLAVREDSVDLRLLCGVPDMGLTAVAFLVDQDPDRYATALYTCVAAGAESREAAEVFGDDAHWFAAYTLEQIPAGEYTKEINVIPLWITADGTRVQGIPRSIRIIDGI